MSQGEQKYSITDLRKWNLVAGGIDPKNDVVPASVSYGLEDALQFAMSEIGLLETRIKRLEEALDKTTKIASQRIKRLEETGDEAICPLEYASRVRIWTKAKDSQ